MSSELKEAREWAERARELLGKGRKEIAERELVELQDGLLKFARQPEVLQKLAPELTKALQDLAGSLSAVGSAEPAEPTPEDIELRKMFASVRKDFDHLRKSLANVLKPDEASALKLALALGDNHALLGQHDKALHLLQQAGHRARAIREEGREGGLVAVVDEDEVQAARRRQEEQARFKKDSETIAGLVAQLDPMSKAEQQQCSLFTLMVYNCVAADQYADALLVLEEWRKALMLLLAQDSESTQRRERLLRQQASDAAAIKQIETSGLAAAVQKIRDGVALARVPLVQIVDEIKAWNGGKPHRLEGTIGTLEFEVERQLGGLTGYARQPALGDEEQKTCARLLVKAEAALLLMQQAETEARNQLAATKKAFADELQARKNQLKDYLEKVDKTVAAQELEVEKKQKAVTQSLEAGKLLKDTSGRALVNALSASSLDFYEKTVTRLNLVKKKSDEEQKLLTLAEKVVKACKAHAPLELALETAKGDLKKLETERSDGRKPLDAALEDAKLPLTIRWDTPADIVYGTRLGGTQLNAQLSAASGEIAYTVVARSSEADNALLDAGTGQRLRAAVIGSDREIYRDTAPVEVLINVLKVSTTVSCRTTLEHHYGAPFQRSLLQASVDTDPAMPDEHANLLAALEVTVEGKPLADNTVLDAKTHTISVRSPGSRNIAASAPVAVTLTVHPAQQEIVWEGAAPTTQTFPAALTALQLNARVRVSTDPPLTERLAALSQALVYEDEKGASVKVGTVLAAGDARRITARTPDRANFLPATKTISFKVDKGVRTLAMAAPPAIGAIVQSSDLKHLRAKASFNPGAGEALFFIEKVELAVGTKVAAGKKRKLRVAAKPDDSYQPTDDREVEVDVLSAADKLQGAKQSNTDLQLKRLHSTQTQALNALRVAAEQNGTDEEKFAKINALVEEVEEIEAKLVTWQGAVRVASPKGEAKALEVVIQEDDAPSEDVKQERRVAKTVEVAKKLVKHGGMALGDIEKLIPNGTPNVYLASAKYPDGFRYEWTTPSGVQIVIYGHGPTVSNAVSAQSDSKKGNLVRMQVDGDYMQPDGTLIGDPYDPSSHMALY